MSRISWRRVHSALRQAARTLDVSCVRLREVVEHLPELVKACGPATQTNKVVIRIGAMLLRGPAKIIVPSCPDYSHSQGRYTFDSVRGGVSLLTTQHIPFLERIVGILPDAQVQVLLADHEADDATLCRVTSLSHDEFLAHIRRSVVSTRKAFAGRGFDWKVALMTEVVPDLVEREAELMEWIRGDSRFARHIAADTEARSGMYSKLGIRSKKERIDRTIRTAAQYMALGQFADEDGRLVVNHSTTNLAWYLKTRTGILHNPVRVY